MDNLSPNNTSMASIYINSILSRIGQNQNLAIVLFKKLFWELPEQIAQLENILVAPELSQAWKIVHTLHGSVSFCGFTELRELAHNLEESLSADDFEQASQDFLLLKEKVIAFQSLEEKILQQLEKLA